MRFRWGFCRSQLGLMRLPHWFLIIGNSMGLWLVSKEGSKEENHRFLMGIHWFY